MTDTHDLSDRTHGSVLFIGTATVLLRYAGFTILTDPNFLHRGESAKLGYGLRSERLTEPALDIAALPPLDLVVLSHLHGDHFDEVAARELDKQVPILAPPQGAVTLSRWGFRGARALDTWQAHDVTKGDVRLRVTAMPGKHAPQPLGALLPAVMGSMLEFSTGGATVFRLYITGDTLVHDRLAEIPRRYPDIDLALLHLGGTRILGVLLTMDAEQGVRALEIVKPKTAIPVHYNDYGVFKSPLEDFQRAVAARALPTQVHYLAHGETYEFPVVSPAASPPGT
jgi:L-ascorbate metabolism protein UlaG (beta-lactamase superfamily)